MLTPDAADFIFSVRPDLYQIEGWDPALWSRGSVAVVSYWFAALRPGTPSDPANQFSTPEQYAAALGYTAPGGAQYTPPAGGTTPVPNISHQQGPISQTPADEETSANWSALSTTWQKHWLKIVVAAAVVVGFRAGWFR